VGPQFLGEIGEDGHVPLLATLDLAKFFS
jgi:hypothetical protein